jgi:hypothetical protein
MDAFIGATVITPHDTNVVTAEHHALHVGLAAGTDTTVVDVAVQFELGTTITFDKIKPGILPIRVKRVMATGSTGSLVVLALRRG